MMIVAHNLTAMNASRQFNIGNRSRAKSSERLSSGYRINRAADDAAGLAISEKMRRQIRGLNQGAENIQSGISLLQVADGALAEVDDMLHRMTELSVKAANGTLSSEDRNYIQSEVNNLAAEITRIGKTTTFNDLYIFDDFYNTGEIPITTLVTSPAAESGHLTEAYQDVNGKWHAASTLDFSSINESNMDLINGKGFSFGCSIGCKEAFEFILYNDGTPSESSDLSGWVTHHYKIDISGCKNGEDIVNAIYNYTSTHIPNNYTSDVPGELKVSHSNVITRGTGADGTQSVLILHETYARADEAAAKKAFNEKSAYGKVDASQLASDVEAERIIDIPIQCSSNVEDIEMIRTRSMNASVIGVNNLNVTSEIGAGKAITSVKKALSKVALRRSELGAAQNRLEHAYKINQNTAENTQAAESQIRDADMAKEVMQESMLNILGQAGIAMMSQANQSNQNVLSLLQ